MMDIFKRFRKPVTFPEPVAVDETPPIRLVELHGFVREINLKIQLVQTQQGLCATDMELLKYQLRDVQQEIASYG